MNCFVRGLVAAALAATPVVATIAAEGPVPDGFYVAPLVTYMQPDSARCGVDGDFGASAMLGHRGDVASLEIWGQYLSLPHGGCTYVTPSGTVTEPEGTVKLNGAGIGLMFGPFFEQPVLRNLHGLVGFGLLLRRGHPQYTADDSTMFGDLGLAYVHPLTLFGIDTAVRADLRYRVDVQQPPYPKESEQNPPPEHKFADTIVNVGLLFGLSRPVAPAPAAPEPVKVVAVADSDGDGIADDRDNCPGTAAGIPVDEAGCVTAAPAAIAPEPAPEPAAPPPTLETATAGDTIVLRGVTFESGSATLTSNAQTVLDGVAEQLAARAELRVEIGGHTDDRGDDAYNQDLSERRAQAVVTYLAEHGIDAGRLTAVGYGEAQPVAGNDSRAGRERNRRVELKVLESPNASPGNAS